MRQLCDLLFTSQDLSWLNGSLIPAFSDTALHQLNQEAGFHRIQNQDSGCHGIQSQDSGCHGLQNQESGCQEIRSQESSSHEIQSQDCSFNGPSLTKDACDTELDTDNTMGQIDTVNALNTLDTLASKRKTCEGHVHCDCDRVDIAASVCIQYDPHLSPLQISRLLVVEPDKRLTAKDALAHSFFKREESNAFSLSLPATFQREEKKVFYPRRMFKAAVITIVAMNKIRLMRLNPPPISLDNVRRDPYGIKTFRKIIDAGAFKIYGHWVKRGENQNRAALFENTPKRDLRGHERQNTLQVLQFEVKSRVGRHPLKLVIGDASQMGH